MAKGCKNGKPLQKPKAGTKIRKLYDMFMQRKGEIVEGKLMDFADVKNSSQVSFVIRNLNDIYGLDIRRISSKKYCLVGEWFGKDYIDYVAARHKD